MSFRPRRAALCALLPLASTTGFAFAQTARPFITHVIVPQSSAPQTSAPQSSALQITPPDLLFDEPRFRGAPARFGTIEIDDKRAPGWGDAIDKARLSKQLMALDGSLTYRAGELGFYRVAYDVVGDRMQGAVRVSVTIVALSGNRTKACNAGATACFSMRRHPVSCP